MLKRPRPPGRDKPEPSGLDVPKDAAGPGPSELTESRVVPPDPDEKGPYDTDRYDDEEPGYNEGGYGTSGSGEPDKYDPEPSSDDNYDRVPEHEEPYDYPTPGEGGDRLTPWIPQVETDDSPSDSDGLAPRPADEPDSTPPPSGDDTPDPPEIPTPRHHPDDLDPDADDDGPVDSRAPQRQERDIDLPAESVDMGDGRAPSRPSERPVESGPNDDPDRLDAPGGQAQTGGQVEPQEMAAVEEPGGFGDGVDIARVADGADDFGAGASAPAPSPEPIALDPAVALDPVVAQEPAAEVIADIPEPVEVADFVVFEPNDEPVIDDDPAELDPID